MLHKVLVGTIKHPPEWSVILQATVTDLRPYRSNLIPQVTEYDELKALGAHWVGFYTD
jgi:hypothetical protein